MQIMETETQMETVMETEATETEAEMVAMEMAMEAMEMVMEMEVKRMERYLEWEMVHMAMAMAFSFRCSPQLEVNASIEPEIEAKDLAVGAPGLSWVQKAVQRLQHLRSC